MNRRDSLKALGLTAVSTGILLNACNTNENKTGVAAATEEPGINDGREPFEIERNKKLNAEKFFTEHEMATIIVLEDIIIPKDAVSGSASDAKVHEFLEFIVKDMPEHQTPLRGGLRWLDMESLKRFEKAFKDLDHKQQIEIVEDIAYPEVKGAIAKTNRKIKPQMEQGVAFFSKMRDMVMTGFFTSEMGVKDIGYMGNTPNMWNGVPDDVLKQYGYAYTEKELAECMSPDKA